MSRILVEPEPARTLRARRRAERWAWEHYLPPWATACAIAEHAVTRSQEPDLDLAMTVALGARMEPTSETIRCAECDREEQREPMGFREGIDSGLVARVGVERTPCPTCGVGELWFTTAGLVACHGCDRIRPPYTVYPLNLEKA